jgi:hypothetical protein
VTIVTPFYASRTIWSGLAAILSGLATLATVLASDAPDWSLLSGAFGSVASGVGVIFARVSEGRIG